MVGRELVAGAVGVDIEFACLCAIGVGVEFARLGAVDVDVVLRSPRTGSVGMLLARTGAADKAAAMAVMTIRRSGWRS